jgi:hypothetical protein
MAKSKEPAEAAAFGQAVAALANRLDARDAETTRAAAVRRLLATFAEPRDDPFPSGLARALEDLAPWLSPDEARAVARLALTAQVSEDDPLSPPRDDLAEVLAVTPRLAPDDARATARWARAEIEAGTPVERMAYLGRVAAAVSPRLDPGEARDACVAACRRLIARIDARGGSPLAEQARALAALAPRVGPDEARAVSRITLGSLATVREGYPFSQLARALAAVAGRMGPGEAPLAANRFLDTFHWSTGLQEQDPPDAVQIRRTLTALTEQLDRDQLLDLLKHPICVGDARKIVLRRLEVVMNHPFATVWDLVDYLEQTEPGLDLSTPPTRPSR